VEAVKKDFRQADIGDKDIAMLSYARKLTLSPSEVKKEDVDKLRKVGFKDPEIHDIAAVTAYYNFVNRIASGLGVELEDYWKEEDL